MTIEKIYKKIFPNKVYLEEYETQILEEIYEYINKGVDSKVSVVYNDIHKTLVTADDLITQGESAVAQLYIETAMHKLEELESMEGV